MEPWRARRVESFSPRKLTLEVGHETGTRRPSTGPARRPARTSAAYTRGFNEINAVGSAGSTTRPLRLMGGDVDDRAASPGGEEPHTAVAQRVTARLRFAVMSSITSRAGGLVGLIFLLALNGLRVSEATGAAIEALGTERGHRTLAITRKGGKKAIIPLAPRTARAIDLAIGERCEGPIFTTSAGQRLDRHVAAYMAGAAR
jgi:integrase